MDMTFIAAVLGNLKTATDLAKLINDSGISLEKAEIKLKMADLITALASARMDIAEIRETILTKDAEIEGLRKQLEIKEKIQWEAPYYWIVNNAKKDGPYCQQCYDKDSKLIRLVDFGDGIWQCATCKNSFRDSTFNLREINNDHDFLL